MMTDAQRDWEALHPTARDRKVSAVPPDRVTAMIEAYRTRTEPVEAVAARFNVSRQTLYSVIHRHAPGLVRRYRRLSEDERRAICAAYQEGRLTTRQIRDQFDIGDGTLYRIVGTLPRRLRPLALSEAERAALIHAYRFSPETVAQIARRFGMSAASVTRLCRGVASYRREGGSRGAFGARLAPMPCPVSSEYLRTYARTMRCITPEIEAIRQRAAERRMARWRSDATAQRAYQEALALLRAEPETERAA